MDTFEAYREPSVKVEPRWAGREDMVDRMTVGDGYRARRSPGKIPNEEFAISYLLGMGIMLPSYQIRDRLQLSLIHKFSLSYVFFVAGALNYVSQCSRSTFLYLINLP